MAYVPFRPAAVRSLGASSGSSDADAGGYQTQQDTWTGKVSHNWQSETRFIKINMKHNNSYMCWTLWYIFVDNLLPELSSSYWTRYNNVGFLPCAVLLLIFSNIVRAVSHLTVTWFTNVIGIIHDSLFIILIVSCICSVFNFKLVVSTMQFLQLLTSLLILT